MEGQLAAAAIFGLSLSASILSLGCRFQIFMKLFAMKGDGMNLEAIQMIGI